MTLSPAAVREKLASVPVIKSGLSLMTGTMVTSGLGLIFWILAANLYDAADFGVATTAVYTMMMLADVACLGLRTGLVRYIPKAGDRTVRTIIWGYGLVTGASTATALVFLAGLRLWAPDLIELRSTGLLFIFFVASTAFWALFMLEDAVLVGLRKAPWVPIENSLFGILKIALLFPLASLSPTLGIFWAWTLPVFPIVIGVNVLVARVASDRTPESETESEPEPESEPESESESESEPETEPELDSESDPTRSLLRDILAFSIADWFAAVARLAALGVIPLLVLAKLDTAQAGYFQASWLMAFTIMALSSNAAYALLAETSYEETKLHRNSVQAGLLSLALTVPIIVVGVIGAPLLLRIYGADYAANSSTVLRILLLAAIPNVIHQIFIGRLRSQGRMVGVVFFETLLSVLVVALAWVFLPRYGIDGVGLAWLAGLGTVAVYAVVSESQWWWAASVDTRLVRGVGSAYRRFRPARPARTTVSQLERILGSVDGFGPGSGDANAAVWSGGGDDSRTAVLPTGGDRELVVEFARSPRVEREQDRRHATIRALLDDPRLVQLHPRLPEPAARGREQGNRFFAWSRSTGPTALDLARSGVPVAELAQSILDAVKPLHEVTGSALVIDDETLERWIERPVGHLVTTGRASEADIDRLRAVLRQGLIGRTLAVGRIHGELALDNVVMSTDPAAVVCLLGWERSTELPIIIDRATLALSDLARSGRQELGSVVRALLRDPDRFESHPAMTVGTEPVDPGTGPAVLLLAWLNLVGQPLPGRRTMSSEVFWLARNARPVLASLEQPAGSSR